VGGENAGVRRQAGQSGERGEHLCRAAFEQSAAAGGKQGVAAKQHVRAVVSQVVEGMTWYRQNRKALSVPFGHVAISNRFGNAVDMRRADNAQVRPFGRECSEPACVVGMMVGDEHRAQLQLLCAQKCRERGGVAGVDGAGFAVLVQNPDIIVGKGFYRSDGRHGDERCYPMSKSFSLWLTETELGRYLLEREQAYFDRAVADVFGYHAVQVGVPQIDFLRENRIPWQCRVGRHPGGDVRCEAAQLPFASGSLDLLALPHVLDFTERPHLVLREAERVLMPEGRLVLTGFNPISLWGVRRMIAGRFRVPWNGNFLPLPRIKDWLALLDLEADGGAFMAYAPPFDRREWMDNCAFMESVGDRWWPLAAGVYGIEAVKRQRGMRMIMPKWRKTKAAGLIVGGKDHHQPVSKQSDKTA